MGAAARYPWIPNSPRSHLWGAEWGGLSSFLRGGGSPPRVKSRRLTPLSGQFFFFFSLTGNMIKWCEVTFKLGDLDPPTDPPSFRNIPASAGPPGVPRCFSSHLLLWQVGQGSLQMIQKGSHQVDAAARYPWIPNSPRSHLWTGR